MFREREFQTLINASLCVSVCVCVRKVYCDKTADWIRMPFVVVSGVGQWMDVLDGAVIVEGEVTVLAVNLGRPTVTNGTLLRSCARATRSSQITLGEDLLFFWQRQF